MNRSVDAIFLLCLFLLLLLLLFYYTNTYTQRTN